MSRWSKYPRFLLNVYNHRSLVNYILLEETRPFLLAAWPGYFCSPIPSKTEVDQRFEVLSSDPTDAAAGIELNIDRQIRLLETFAELSAEFPFADDPQPNLRFYLDNPYFAHGDSYVLYGMLRTLKPRRVVEVGSGFSSAAMLDVSNGFLNDEPEFTFIDPNPERLETLLKHGDRQRTRVLEQQVQEVPLSVFGQLEKGDFLFVDSSHVVKVGSDVNHLIAHVLPLLAEGVIVHFHDVFWPFEYPRDWLDLGRAWNELYVLRAFLQYNSAFEVMFFGSFLEACFRETLEEHCPTMLRQPSAPITKGNSSLWLRKRESPHGDVEHSGTHRTPRSRCHNSV